jgi:pyruvate/2-oxoglutarate dehydrogenase complex dihydrolipoamide dehydrogenase (E3) component
MVNGSTIRFRNAVIATGARAAAPPIPGLAEAGFLTNETVFSLTALPRRLAVIGAGPIGCEMSQAFRRLGADVWLLETHSQILAREDRDAAEVLEQAFVRDGVHLVLGCTILRVERRGPEKLIQFSRNGTHSDLAVDEILVGAGRAPNVEGLNLEAAGVVCTRDGVQVNDYLQTTNPRIYGAGDICLPHKFTHTADATARIVLQNALFLGRKKVSALVIPWCTYTDPEIAHVGVSEREARERGIPVETFVRPLREVDRAIADGDEEGFVKVHVKQGTDRILGATIVARHAGDMLGEITVAMVGNLGLKTIANVIHPYPTQAEAIRQVADAYNRTRLTPWIKKLLSLWLGWMR